MDPRNVRVLGDLFLEDPITANLSEDHRTMIENVLPDLRRLEARDLNGERHARSVEFTDSHPVLLQDAPNLTKSFEDFRDREIQAWVDEGRSPPPKKEHLVRPSGPFSARIIHHLNQPSMTTGFLSDGQVADRTNGCTAMVMGDAYHSDHAFMIDQVLRREAESEALENYPKRVLQVHEQYVAQLLDHTAAKISVVYGRKVQRWMLQNSRYQFTPFPLYGRFDGHVLFLLHESSCSNQQPGFKFRRAIIFCAHPERLFREPKGSQATIHQSKCIEIAAKIAGQPITHDPQYYQEKKWLRHIPNFYQITQLKAANALAEYDSLMFSSNQKSSELAMRPCKATQGSEDFEDSERETIFDECPHSNDALRALLPQAIKETRTSTTEWQSLKDMPESVVKWLRGQKEVSFPTSDITDLIDIPLAFETTFKHRLEDEDSGKHSAPSVKHALLKIMRWQADDLQSIRFPHQHLWHSRFDHVLFKTCCYNCGQSWKDKEPRWFVALPGYYLVKKGRPCQSKVCGGKKRLYVPLDLSTPYHSTEMSERGLSCTALLNRQVDFRPYLHSRASLLSTGLDSVISCWCITCTHDTTVYKDGEIVKLYEDRQPQWTLGLSRHLYVTRRPTCRTCEREGRATAGSRFTPVDNTIESIHTKSLRLFVDLFGNQSSQVRRILMDHWPASNNVKRVMQRDYK